MQRPLSLPGLTPKSGVPDFGASKIAKVGNIRLWLQSIFSRRGWTTRTRVFPSSGTLLDGRKSETSDLRWSSPRVTPDEVRRPSPQITPLGSRLFSLAHELADGPEFFP